MKKKISKNYKIQNKPFINGLFYKGKIKKSIKRISPSSSYKLPNLYICEEKEVNLAIQTAKDSFQQGVWKNYSANRKKKIFFKAANLIKKEIKEISLIDCLETGRSIINFERDSLPKAIEVIRYFTESLDKIYDLMKPLDINSMGLITKQPLGVVTSLTAWNDPLVPAMWKACPAILMGNSIVMKPSELSSFSLLRVAELFSKAGLPDGVMNVVTGDSTTGKKLVIHKDIEGVFFTGSTKTGVKISKLAYSKNKIKKISLECGGKSCFIVSEKCTKIKEAARVLAKNIFYNQGQTCSAPSRLIINKNIKKKFLGYLFEETKKFIPKDPLHYKSEVGGLVSKNNYNKVKKFFKIGIKEKNKYKTFNQQIWKNKYAFPPTIFYDVKKNSTLLKEEIFGPILACIEYKDNKEAIKLANDNNYGLASAIWSDDFYEIHNFINKIDSGIVHINSYGEDDNSIPFGGIKNSGNGKDKSILAFNEYTYLKSIYFQK